MRSDCTFAHIKYPVTILLILLVATQTFSKWTLILGYEINKDYIAKNLCVNRAKPSCCQGKCFLEKKLANDESGQQTPTGNSQKDPTPEPLFCQEQGFFTACIYEAGLPVHYSRFLFFYPHGFALSLFEPPQSAV